MTVLVTGGSSPLALDLASKICEEGEEVLLVTRTNHADVQKFAEHEPLCSLITADLALSPAVDELCRLVTRSPNLRGMAFCHRVSGEVSVADQIWTEVLAPAQLLAAMAGVESGMERSVVFYSSPSARVVVADQPLGYHIAKSSINSLVRWASVKYGDIGLRVNAVAPGAYVAKERSREFYQKNPDRVVWAKQVTPLSRFADPREITELAHFLLSSKSSFVTGEIIDVDGGTSNIDPPSLRNFD